MEALFSTIAKDLLMHLIKEEQTLFPYIARVEEAVQQKLAVSWPPFGTVENPIRMMVLEHDQTGEELKEIGRLSNDTRRLPVRWRTMLICMTRLERLSATCASTFTRRTIFCFPVRSQWKKRLAPDGNRRPADLRSVDCRSS